MSTPAYLWRPREDIQPVELSAEGIGGMLSLTAAYNTVDSLQRDFHVLTQGDVLRLSSIDAELAVLREDMRRLSEARLAMLHAMFENAPPMSENVAEAWLEATAETMDT